MRHAPLGKLRQFIGTESSAKAKVWPAAAVVVMATASLVAAVGPSVSASSSPNDFTRTNLIANKKGDGAKFIDPNLKNAWGLAAGASTPLWVSDNNSGMATVYSGGINGSAVKLDLTVPVPGMNPTGQVFNTATKAFPVGGTTGKPAFFIVDSDSIGTSQSPGEIAAWNGGAKFVVEDSPKGGPGGTTPAHAVFKGLAMTATSKAGPELFAADVANATVDVFNHNFAPVKTPTEFVDPKLPAGYAPFNVQNLNGMIYVAYGKQNKSKTDVIRAAGLGIVDVFTVDGKFVRRMVSNGSASPLDAPWGMAIAPAKFGAFGGDLLVGNLGNGWIDAFNPTTGKFMGTLDNSTGYPITVNDLWGIEVGNSAFGGASSLVFSGGPANYANGVVGVINPAK